MGVPRGLECLVLAQEEKGPGAVWEDTREGGAEVEMGGALGRQGSGVSRVGAVRWEAREDGQETSGASLGMLHEVWGSCPYPETAQPSQSQPA